MRPLEDPVQRIEETNKKLQVSVVPQTGSVLGTIGDTGGHIPSVGVWGDSLEHVTSELRPKVRDSQEGQSSEGTEAECVPTN